MLSKDEKINIKRESNIKSNVKMQHDHLEKRIYERKLRSSSKNKLKSPDKLQPLEKQT